MGLGRRYAGVLLLAFTGAAQSLPVAAVKVTGNQRLPAVPIVLATGVRTGQTLSLPDLDAAVRALSDTGLFTLVNYRYEQVPGSDPPAFTITLQVSEDPTGTDVHIDIA